MDISSFLNRKNKFVHQEVSVQAQCFASQTRSLDVTHWLLSMIGVFLLIILSPLMILIALAILIFNGRPIFYTQIRVGRDCKIFTLYKFRTMINDAEKATGPVLASKNDHRETSVGKFLRVCHLDELPQILNVIKGDMSFIGPRPERPFFAMQYLECEDGYKERFNVLPGITGLAQVMLPYDALFSEKLIFDQFHIRNSFYGLLNMLIVFFTLFRVFQIPYQRSILYLQVRRLVLEEYS